MTSSSPLFPEFRHRVSQELIDRYARVSGDLNPLHIDPEFAATTHFGRTIAHGMMALAFVSNAMEAWVGSRWIESSFIDVTFLAPVFPGDEITITGACAESDEAGGEAISIRCRTGSGDVLVGRASIGPQA